MSHTDPRYDGFRISTLWAWTVVDPTDNQEGIAAFRAADGTFMPLIGSDRVRIDDLRGYAQAAADLNGTPARLRMFTGGEVLEELEPEPPAPRRNS